MSRRGLAWIAVPFVAYVLVFAHLCFDAPISDDFDVVLYEPMRMMDAHSLVDWIGIVFAQHNEHRIAVMRITAWAMEKLLGHVDFRALALFGDLTIVGLVVLMWAEYRSSLAPPLFAAAGFLVFQWSYYEASLMASATLPNIGVVFFSFACLYFAWRGGAAGAAACIAFGLLAEQSQANGLFALPLAAAACALMGRRARAALLAAVALVVWVLYFLHYYHPAGHPSAFAALTAPLSAVQLFLIVVGGIHPGRWTPMAIGAALLALLAWLWRKGAWKAHPTAGVWIAFVLLSAAAATAGRVGFGVFQTSRYAVYPSCLIAIAFLALAEMRRPWTGARMAGAIVAAALFSFAVSWKNWPNAVSFARAGHLLVKAVPASADVSTQPYPWVLYPSPQRAWKILADAEARGLYSPREVVVHAPAFRWIDAVPAGARAIGQLDNVRVSGRVVSIDGWSDIPASVATRTLAIASAARPTGFQRFTVQGRPDVAMILGDPALVLSGFRMEIEYASEPLAQEAARRLCVVSEAPGRAPELLPRTDGGCAAGPAR